MDQRPLRIDVLSPSRELIASFASAVEACRYAALVCELDFSPVLRRASDGAELTFVTTSNALTVAEWADDGCPAVSRPTLRWSAVI